MDRAPLLIPVCTLDEVAERIIRVVFPKFVEFRLGPLLLPLFAQNPDAGQPDIRGRPCGAVRSQTCSGDDILDSAGCLTAGSSHSACTCGSTESHG